MNKPSHDDVLNLFRENGYPLKSFNLIGFRDESNIEKDVINDLLGFLTEKELFLCPGTTDPGVYWTTSSERNKKGTFHLSLGYHEKIWCIGTHKGYEALVNDYRYCKPTRGWRDKDYDFTRDPADVEVCDYFGINFHRMHPIQIVNKIGKYSAGCQVIQNPKDFDYILQKAWESAQKTFDYALFEVK
jgi:hypothetical protein